MKIILWIFLLIGVLVLILVSLIRPDPVRMVPMIPQKIQGGEDVSVERGEDFPPVQKNISEQDINNPVPVESVGVDVMPLANPKQISNQLQEKDLFEIDPGFGGGLVKGGGDLPKETNYEKENIQIEYCN